jgi:tetratricopeptide (TPR) repeat protein
MQIKVLSLTLALLIFVTGFHIPQGRVGNTKAFTAKSERLVQEDLSKLIIKRVDPVYSADVWAAFLSAPLSWAYHIFVLVDEDGNVISAKPVMGSSLGRDAAHGAANVWKFKPRKGVIIKGRIVLTQKDDTFTPKYRQSIEYNEDVVRKDPLSVLAHCRLAYAYSKNQKYQEAEQEFKKALSLSGKPLAGIYYGLGWNYTKSLRYREALEAYRQALRLNPNFVEAWFAMGWVYCQLGGMNIDKIDPEDRYIRGVAIGFVNSYSEVYDRAFRGDPAKLRRHSFPTREELKAFDLEKINQGIEAIKNGIAVRPDPDIAADGWTEIASICRRSGQLEKAAQAHQEVIKSRTELLDLFYEDEWDRDELKSSLAQEVNILGLVYEQLGEYQKAIAQYRQSAKIAAYSPAFDEAYARIIALNKKLGQEAEVEETLKEYLGLKQMQVDGPFEKVSEMMRACYWASDLPQYTPDYRMMKKVSASAGFRAKVLIGQARAYEEAERYQEAIRLLKRSAELQEDPWPHAALMLVYRKMGDLDAAQKEQEALNKLGPMQVSVPLSPVRLKMR